MSNFWGDEVDFSIIFFAFLDVSTNITIYLYTSKEVDGDDFKGLPVVLNFKDNDMFLRCFKTENGVNISVAVSYTRH